MNTKFLFVFLLSLTVSAYVIQAAPTASVDNPADRFAGTLSSIMSATDDPSAKAGTVTTIPIGCSAKGICGDAINLANG